MAEPATRMVLNEARIRELAGAKGLKNVEMIAAKARELELTLDMATIYRMLSGSNFNRKSVEAVAKVLECDLSEIVTFEPESEEGPVQ